jgi:Icc-related predicted phosphoesterase
MKIITISDTHGYHDLLALPKGDMLIHAGDVSSRGSEREIKDFLGWFSVQDYEYKIFIAGNHDFFFEQADKEMVKAIIPENIIYLNDSGICIEGLHIWGSPVTPWFLNWAFNRQRGSDIKKHWDLIPQNTDILITHGPVYGILDKTIHGKKVGCEILKDVTDVIKPKVHICGHIHEAYGQVQILDTLYINASVLDVRYRLVNEAVMFEI